MSGEQFSELQAVDFALGAYIAQAFTGLAEVGTKEWKEFTRRPVSRKVYRSDKDSPQEFFRALLASRKAEKTTAVTGELKNSPELPVVYYFRKPGMTNSDNNKPIKAGVFWNEGLTKAFDLISMPISLDYQVFLLAWDKPTLDKMMLAYYAWQTRHDKFACMYGLATAPTVPEGLPGGEVLEVNAYIQDHRTITFTNSSAVDKDNRLYAVTMPISLNTQVLAGAEVVPPQFIEIQFAAGNVTMKRYPIDTCDGVKTAFAWSAKEVVGSDAGLMGGRLYYKGALFAIWYAAGWRLVSDANHTITGQVDIASGNVTATITPALPAGSLEGVFGINDCPGYL